ncbi:MAG: hypothetical protein LM582_01450 [Desulfurococcaceae archaeon]|nr:hypothetical protein [Desulfurococcaceae archaeon]
MVLKPLFKVKAGLAGGDVKEVDVAPIAVEITGRREVYAGTETFRDSAMF